MLKQHRIDRFSPSETGKKFLGRKKLKWQSTSQQKVQTDTPTKLFSQKCSNLTFLWGFQIFKIEFFVIFGFPSKNNFFELQTYFCFLQKISRLVSSQIQQKFWTLFFFFLGGGGWKNASIYPPPKKKKKIQKSDFANIVVKCPTKTTNISQMFLCRIVESIKILLSEKNVIVFISNDSCPESQIRIKSL